MNVKEWLENAESTLRNTSETPRLDVEVLLADALGREKSWLLAHPEFVLQGQTLQKLDALVLRRAGHEPLAYIRGKSEFYGRDFLVDKRVLVPRPESETMIDLARKVIGGRLAVREDRRVRGERLKVRDKITCVDVGSGSGALAITIKLEMPELEVTGVDISSDCLKIAKRNASNLGADIKFYQGNLLTPVSNLSPLTSHLFILANLPYVPTTHPINQAATHEPKLAIFGGPDGLDLYRELFTQISNLKPKNFIVLTESLDFQHAELKKIAKVAGYKQIVERDLIQVFEIR